LRSVIPYEAAAELWPPYLRGQAWLQLEKPGEAEAEFRKILDHRGHDPISPLYPLAKLGLARSAALRRDADLSQKLYREFLADWKDADPDLPALVESLRAVGGQRALR
jgi:eukaryotic-like serine/threonine-protein kinase